MCNSLINRPLGGGVAYLPSPEIIVLRTRFALRRYYHIDPDRGDKVRADIRQVVTIVLNERYLVPQKDIAHLLHVSERQVRRDMCDARWFHDRYVQRRDEENRLFDYILYNAKFIRS